MKKGLSILFALLQSITLVAQQLPDTEIYLFDLSIKKSKISVSNPKNVTNHMGYDNQPFFHPDKTVLYFTSADTTGNTEIKEYNYLTGTTQTLTHTAEREYSPTVTPDKNFISCIIQRADGAQDLGKYPIDGGEPEIVINTLTIGYHAWIDNESLLLFVLGDTMTLHRINLTTRKDEVLAQNIGRSLHRIPHSSSMSFVQKVLEKEWFIQKLTSDGLITKIKSTLPAREDLAWTPDGKILMSNGTNLFFMQPGIIETWQSIKVPQMPKGTITRLAVNELGDKLAVVVGE
jgi:hypothetical protein